MNMIFLKEGYRCYLFKCQDHCTFVSHEGYVVMTQVSINQNKKKNDQKVITGERKDRKFKNLKINFRYEKKPSSQN